jgi:hypothetical protein
VRWNRVVAELKLDQDDAAGRAANKDVLSIKLQSPGATPAQR